MVEREYEYMVFDLEKGEWRSFRMDRSLFRQSTEGYSSEGIPFQGSNFP